MHDLWILEGRTPKRCPNLRAWGLWMAENDRHVACTELHTPGAPPVVISTVFLGVDHNFWGGGPPILFETMTFAPGDADGQWRYATWEEAEAGHAAAIARLRVMAPAENGLEK